MHRLTGHYNILHSISCLGRLTVNQEECILFETLKHDIVGSSCVYSYPAFERETGKTIMSATDALSAHRQQANQLTSTGLLLFKNNDTIR